MKSRMTVCVFVGLLVFAGVVEASEQEALDEMLPECVAKNVSVIIGAPYNSGMLATPDRARATYDYKPVDDARWQKAQAIRAICDRHGVDIRAAALQYPLQHPAVVAVIPGVRELGELESNLGLMEVVIPDALWTDLDEAGLSRRL